MASKGGWKRKPVPLANMVDLDLAGRKKLGLEVSTIVRERAFPSTGAGHDEDGGAYTPYSTKRIYVSKSSPPRPADMPAPRGVTARTLSRQAKKGAKDERAGARGLTSKERKTVRFDGGYSQYRAAAGRSSGANKNLVMSGQTARALSYLRSTTRSIIIGFRSRRERARQLDALYRFMGLTDSERARARGIYVQLVREQMAQKRSR